MNKNHYHYLVSLALIFFLGQTLALAQAGRGVGRLGGVVLDNNDKPVVGAKLVLTYIQDAGGGLKLEATTNKRGEWSFIGLGSGRWSLMVSAEGFAPMAQEVTVSQLEKNPRITIKLQKAGGGVSIIQDQASLELLDQGNQFFQEGKYDTALAMFEQFYEKNPSAYQILLNIGDCYREKGEIDKAMEYYNQVMEKAKGDISMGVNMTAKALAAIGLIYLKQDNLEEAAKYFKQSVDTAPQDEVVAFNVGEVFFTNQKLDEAERYFKMASGIKPDWPEPYLKLGYVALNKNDMAAAVEYFEKFLKLEPQDSPRVAMVQQILQAIKK
ncbi:MAG: tetratricopeptide repeat protein [Candidatus Saccharicenans sp.]|uniref:tetratricopeptide repeat protein n=1 Tax=Candidatus Saccharicenans sp. TaxID=2819258 RepID=UPI00404A2540